MLIESIVVFAFLIGLLSALSLPLGALTIKFWAPGEKEIAWLMAFGAGALLSAVTIDLFAPSIHNGHFIAVAIGSIIGSVFYLFLNNQLNQKGGFLRKTATLIQYIRHQQKLQNQQLCFSINRLELFKEIEESDYQKLFSLFKIRHLKANQVVFHKGDPLNEFYIIQSGRVNLRKASLGLKVVAELEPHDVFGHFGFLSSQQSAFLAQAADDVTLWVLERNDINQLIVDSDSFYETLLDYFKNNDELLSYLQTDQGQTVEQSLQTVEFIYQVLKNERRLPFNREQRTTYEDALHRLNHSSRFDLFDSCPDAIKTVMASKLKKRTAKDGETLFAHNADADRLYLLDSGRVALIDPKKRSTANECLLPGAFFGGMAFVVGGRHSSTAIANSDVTFWVLEKSDFEILLNHVPTLNEKLAVYLKNHKIRDYLTTQQRLSVSKAEQWVKKSTKKMMPNNLPNLTSVDQHVHQHKAAYLAIWLGIFLDGIPESLMIGSHISNSHMMSVSLIAAIFISNYPEALSSSASMQEQGIPFKKILFAWTSLMIMTGIGAGIGNVILAEASPDMFAFISGMAAGAMLTVIAETMLPEAYARGGSIIGFVTLVGFLSAIMFKFFD